MTLSVLSSTFQDGHKIPMKYTCDGQDISPPLAWGEVPQGTQAFALIVDDPDAPFGVWTHWVLFNIPSDNHELPEGAPIQDQLPSGALQGRNDFGRIGYGVPWPPGPGHRYRFIVYALEKPLSLKAGASKREVLDAMQGCILDQGQFTGIYR